MQSGSVSPASFQPLVIRALVLPLVLITLFAAVMLWQVARLISASGWVDHTDRVIAEANELRSLHSDMQTGVRGYLITGDDRFRESFDFAEPLIEQSFGSLLDLVKDNPQQTRRVQAIHDLEHEWLAYVRQEMVDRKNGGPWEEEVKRGVGKARMDGIRSIFEEFLATEATLRDQRSTTARRSAVLSLWLTVGMGVLLGAALTLISRQHLKLLANNYAEALALANQSAEELEQRVAMRTAELAEAIASLKDAAAERQRASDALEVLNVQLALSNRELQDFAAVASHDLQEPLRKVQAFGDRLKVKCGLALGAEGADYLERMLNAADRMKTLINDLLTFARVTSRAQPFGSVDLKAVVQQVLSDMETRIEETGATVHVGDLPMIDADVTQMRQLLQNLIGNAIKFAKAGQKPEVFVESSIGRHNGREMLDLIVRDNGIGFDEKYTDRIFTVFQRLHGREQYEGTGIGLAVCRKIAERHRGSIEARSRPGEGSVFIVHLPVHQPASLNTPLAEVREPAETAA